MIVDYIGACFGTAQLRSVDSSARKEVWGLLKTFLEKADEKIYLEDKYRDGASGILLAINDGIITIEEGERLIDIHAKIRVMETQGGLNALNLTQIPSLTINTYTEPQKVLEEPENNASDITQES
jgi:hypothetical protein